jgi:transposase-like protein
MKNTHHPRYARHRFPAEVISYAVWLYFRFPLSLRMVEENSHQPTRRRDRIMKRFKSAGQAQRFLSVHDQVANLFRRSTHSKAADHRRARARAFQVWTEITGVVTVA